MCHIFLFGRLCEKEVFYSFASLSSANIKKLMHFYWSEGGKYAWLSLVVTWVRCDVLTRLNNALVGYNRHSNSSERPSCCIGTNCISRYINYSYFVHEQKVYKLKSVSFCIYLCIQVHGDHSCINLRVLEKVTENAYYVKKKTLFGFQHYFLPKSIYILGTLGGSWIKSGAAKT